MFLFIVGRCFGEPPLAAFSSAEDASNFIGLVIAIRDPEGVAKGDYYIDGPEREV